MQFSRATQVQLKLKKSRYLQPTDPRHTQQFFHFSHQTTSPKLIAARYDIGEIWTRGSRHISSSAPWLKTRRRPAS